jgi:hypothetical protein
MMVRLAKKQTKQFEEDFGVEFSGRMNEKRGLN